MKKYEFKKRIGILVASNTIVHFIEFLFMIYFTRFAGAEGLGLYSIILPINSIFLSLMTDGMATSISKVTADYYKKNDYVNLQFAMKIALILNTIWSLIVALILFLSIPFIAKNIVNDYRVVLSVYITCPSLVVMSITNILKGYFWGTSRVLVPSIIDVFEKISRLVLLVMFAKIFMFNEVSNKVFLVFLSLCICEFISLIFLFAYYLKVREKEYKLPFKRHSSKYILSSIIQNAIPLCLTGFLLDLFGAIFALLIPHRLLKLGYLYETALSMFGEMKGMAMSIAILPMVVTKSINTLVVPKITQIHRNGNKEFSIKLAKKSLNITYITGIFTMIICVFFGKDLGLVLFKKDIGRMVFACGIISPLMFVSSILYACLVGIDEQRKSFINTFIQNIFTVIAIFLFMSIKELNIYGFVIAMGVSHILSIALNNYDLKQKGYKLINSLHIFLYFAIIIFLIINYRIYLH